LSGKTETIVGCFICVSVLGIVSPALGGSPTGQKAIYGFPQREQVVSLSTVRGQRNAHRFRLLARLVEAPGTAKAAQVSVVQKRLGAMRERVAKRYGKLSRLVVLEEDAAIRLPATVTEAAHAERLQARIKALRSSGLFEVVEPDWVMRVLATPSDAAFADGRLWGLRNTGQSGGLSGADVGAPSAWDITTGSAGVTVGVIDTGIRYTHQDLAGNMWVNPGEVAGNGVDDDSNGFVDDVYGINAIASSGNPMDDNGHGSHCAGTIGAVANGSGPHVGVAWNVRLMALKFLDSDGSGYSSDAITCIDYAIDKGVDILSNSWGGGGYSSVMAAAVQRAQAAGILFVAAAGNEANNNDTSGSYPANYTYDNVISVAALDRSDQLASFSNYGATTVDLGAPGVTIYSCTAASDTSYSFYSGTSMATPHVAGVAALVVAQYPSISMAELRQRLLSTTVPVAALSGRCVTGGRVNAFRGLSSATDGILEVAVTAGSTPVIASEQTAFYVQVSDLTPVLNATVTGGLAGQAAVPFLDGGVTPDASASDGVYSVYLTAPAVSGDVDVVVDVTAPGKQSTTVTQRFSVVGRPANDDFAGRILASPGASSVFGANLNASIESGEPRYASGAGSQTVWWSWVAPASGSATISTLGSDFDTILAIYTGSSVGSLTLVGGNDDYAGLLSSVSFSAQSGTVYAIQVNGYSSSAGNVQLNLPVLAGSPSIVDEPDDVRVLIGTSFSLQVQAQGQSPLTYQWYRDGAIIPGETATTYSRTAAILTDTGNYRVVVSNAVGTATSRDAFVAVERVDVHPDNDDFDESEPLTGTSGRLLSGNALATGETGEPNHAGVASPLASIWYHWTAPVSGSASINTFGSEFDTVLAVYTGETFGSLLQVAANDDAGGGLQSEVDIDIVAGVTYRVAIDGYSSDSGATTLDYHVTASNPPSLSLPGGNSKVCTVYSGAYEFRVGANLAWTAAADSPWISVTSANPQLGDGTASFSVTANPSASARAGSITISGGGITQQFAVTQLEPVPGPAILNDFDGDLRSDIAVYWPAGGTWYVLGSSVGRMDSQFGWSETTPVPGDYDGDGLADVAVYLPASGQWYIKLSSGGRGDTQFGWSDMDPVPGDYDGDGTTDVAVYKPALGQWYIKLSGGGRGDIQFGWSETTPVPGDYDGDGTTDVAVYWQATGMWYIKLSGGGRGDTQFGWSEADPVPGDYDGDGITDVAVYSGGQWSIKYSGGGRGDRQWGMVTDIPIPADYDGDGATDIGVFRQSSSEWFILNSSGSPAATIQQFGWSETPPVTHL
jgi:subtilisin family serine protease